MAPIACRTKRISSSISWKLKSMTLLTEIMPSLFWASSRIPLAAAKAVWHFLEASIAEFTSFVCKTIKCWNVHSHVSYPMKKHGCREEIEHIMAQQNWFWLKFSHGKTTYPITYYKGSPVNINETTSPLYMLKIYHENLRTWPNPSFQKHHWGSTCCEF